MLFHLKKNRGNLTKKSKVLNFRYVLTNMSIHVSILYYNDLLLNNQKTITNLKFFVIPHVYLLQLYLSTNTWLN